MEEKKKEKKYVKETSIKEIPWKWKRRGNEREEAITAELHNRESRRWAAEIEEISATDSNQSDVAAECTGNQKGKSEIDRFRNKRKTTETETQPLFLSPELREEMDGLKSVGAGSRQGHVGPIIKFEVILVEKRGRMGNSHKGSDTSRQDRRCLAEGRVRFGETGRRAEELGFSLTLTRVGAILLCICCVHSTQTRSLQSSCCGVNHGEFLSFCGFYVNKVSRLTFKMSTFA